MPSICVKLGGCLGIARRPTEGSMAHSVDDASSLLDTLLVMASFLLAFSLELTVSTFSHDDLLQADTRNIIVKEGLHRDDWFLLSQDFLNSGLASSTCLLTSVFAASAINISLAYSDARESNAAFNRWFKWFKYGILLSYVVFAVGVCYFFLCAHLAIEMVYPRYSIKSADLQHNLEFFSLMRSRFWNTTTSQLVELQDSELSASTQLAQSIRGLGVAWEVSNDYKDLFLAMSCVAVFLIIVVSFVLRTAEQELKKNARPIQRRSASANIELEMVELEEDPDLNEFLSRAKISGLYLLLNRAGLTYNLLLQNANQHLLNELLKDAGIALPGQRLALIAALQGGLASSGQVAAIQARSHSFS
jgi:hypothetical protein